MGAKESLLTLAVLVYAAGCVSGELEDMLDYFETLHPSQFKHRIVKRDTSSIHPHTRQVEFDSMGRHFHLYLQKKRGVLSKDFRLIAVDEKNNEREVDMDIGKLYQGYALDEVSTSRVQAVLEDDDTMMATIYMKEDIYVVEPSWRHLPDSDNYTMIMYKGSDMRMKKDFGDSYCGYVDMNVETEDQMGKDGQQDGQQDRQQDGEQDGHQDGQNNKKHREENKMDQKENNQHHKRDKRQTMAASTSSFYRPSKTTCHLMLVADYRFFEFMGQNSLVKTSSYLIGLIDRVDHIYRNTNFEQGYMGMGFEIKEMRIHEAPTTVIGGNGIHYNEKREKWDTKSLLETFSRDAKFKDFCLAHLFTHHAFEGGVLGLAYIGSPRQYSVGGICSPEYYKGGYKLYLNTGWSSSLNRYDRRLLTQEADLVTTHEFGHNWGSEHDPDTSECSPSSFKGGKYIMYTYSVSGYDTNNKVFSPCSQRSMGAVLRSKSQNCFVEARKAYCGNSRVEPGEECDVGPEGQKDLDSCCTGECKLRPKATCSDMNHDCCMNCQYGGHKKCREESACEMEAYCNGSSECPPSRSKSDGEACLDRGKCKEGKCLPFCETINKFSCICDNVTDSCLWCCKDSANSTCKPHMATLGTYQNLRDGMPCLQGYCHQGQCMKQVQDLVERFWNIIENITASQLVAFMRANIVGTVIVLSLIIWIPVSCLVSYKDRKRREEEQATEEWLRYDNPYLVRPQDSDRIKTLNKTLHRRTYKDKAAMYTQRVGASDA